MDKLPHAMGTTLISNKARNEKHESPDNQVTPTQNSPPIYCLLRYLQLGPHRPLPLSSFLHAPILSAVGHF